MYNKSVIIRMIAITALAGIIVLLAVPRHPACEEAKIILRTGQITDLTGEVDLKKANKNFWTDASAGLIISQHDVIKTADGASVDIEFLKEDGGYFKIRLRDKSRVTFTTLEYDRETYTANTMLDLAIGDILIKADRLNPKSKFKVRTPVSMIGIRGTKFEVIYK